MKEHKKLDEKIKSSFESLNRKAPDMLWSQLSDSLPAESADPAEVQPENGRLYNKIRDSFSSLRQTAPQHTWERINRQLNIDLVWSRLHRELDKSPSASWNTIRWAAVLLLLILSFAGLFYLNNHLSHPPHAKVAGNETVSSAVPAEKRKAPETGQAALSSRKEQKGISAVQVPSFNEESSAVGEPQKDLILSFQPPFKDRQQKAPAYLNQVKDDANGSKSVLVTEDEQGSASAISLSGNAGQGGRPTASKYMSAVPYRVAGLPMLNPVVKKRTFSVQAVALDSRALKKLAEAEEVKEVHAYRLSFGPVVAYNNSWLLNNETRSSFDKGSLISTSPTFKQNMGFALHYSLNNKSALASEFHFISKAGQEYNAFSDGYFLKKGLELSYYKLYLHYQRNLLQHGESLLSDLTLKAGVYGGLLHRKNGNIRQTESTYSSFDYGIHFSFGQEKRINRVIIGYGIAGERGLMNIFMGSGKIPARFNKTYTLNYGPYLNFRYLLK
ncbi:hypothetical protein [Nafulsella turpanensis]|uniref:hypothetical protein n=1 Tax=Nafulsella turpanensis TaxID=1265690 RepID=UPI001267BDF3|nr:hypothetical protein [Nafulsella turpanensis]